MQSTAVWSDETACGLCWRWFVAGRGVLWGSHQGRRLQTTGSPRLGMSAYVELQALRRTRRTQHDVPPSRTAVAAVSASSGAACGSSIQLSCRGSASARHRLTQQADPALRVSDRRQCMLEAPTYDRGAHAAASASLSCWEHRSTAQCGDGLTTECVLYTRCLRLSLRKKLL